MHAYSLRKALLNEEHEIAGTDVVPAISVFPIQRDLNAKNVFFGLQRYRPGGRTRPALCCLDSDGTLHLIDGHHGWATACLGGGDIQIKIIEGNPESIAEELLKSGCEKSNPIPPELDLKNPDNDIMYLIDMYGSGLNVSPDDIRNLPRPLINRGEGIYKKDMPQCDHLRK